MDQRESSPLPPAVRWLGPILAAGYSLGASANRALAKAREAPLPVICVGNITAGGTGKTPAVQYFARELCSRGLKPAVLLRGYKEQGSDEALEIETGLRGLAVPVLVSADRYASSLAAKANGRDVALLDDGFQHWKLRRDLDIVLIDATDPFGGGHMLPWGRLREAPEGLARAGAIVITRADTISAEEQETLRIRLQELAPGAIVASARHRPASLREIGGSSHELALLKDMPALAACGLGNPEGFVRTLKSLGANVLERAEFADHHAFSTYDIKQLEERAARVSARAILVTEKDAVKIQKLGIATKIPILCLGVRFELLTAEAGMWQRVNAALVGH